ncbi:hypothetical protein BDV25DRAFT_142417 [Aspergillus avenaceus]|uniref:T6SS Phospholipase effector Tle1-like catalytic domain-containing protein n=1 Tax=Aspergillus avenaceus TaxID=36643 RepID=A0A5N6TN94_ASPAV|nr:hypothetical protein BDV25DRAFT_142417 [Aspergillus avenaceus]
MSCPDQRHPSARVIVLCFDGTSNTFQADNTESNILKIFHCYYQPGIGTEVAPTSLSSNLLRRRSKLWKNKILDSALAISFDQHVLGGYRFLMKHYRTGSKIYIFGFSRGAYTARFLNEMLDVTGLLAADNEEMIPFVWEAFRNYKKAIKGKTSVDVEEKEKAWAFLKACNETIGRAVSRVHFLGLFDTVNSTAEFQVSTEARPTSVIIRHALSIDERRVKFYPVLIDPRKNYGMPAGGYKSDAKKEASVNDEKPRRSTHGAQPSDQDLQEVWFPGGHADVGGGWAFGKTEQWKLGHGPLVWMIHEAKRAGLQFDEKKIDQLVEKERQADLPMDEDFEKPVQDSNGKLFESLRIASTQGLLHDYLKSGEGVPSGTARSWRLMEYMPFRRMILQPDGSWKPTRWRLHRGRRRDIPLDAQIHISVIDRMTADPTYRPANLILRSCDGKLDLSKYGYGIGEWVVWDHEGDLVRQTFVRK